MDEKRISVVVLLDMSKAFDSIQHDNVLSKLHLLGVSAFALAWFKTYLSLRKQVVRMGSDLSVAKRPSKTSIKYCYHGSKV